jgi:Zn-dependent peptidase ImmA (M78 family)/transcriptional regulator with XRE-family HTH domain
MIFGDRVKQARELRKLTQFELAERLGVTQSFISQIEGGRANPPDEFMSKLVFEVGFPPSFFEQPTNDDFPFGSLLFRAHTSMTDLEQREIYRWAQTVYELYRRMTAVRSIREVPLHVPRAQQPPALAAALARSELGLAPDVPVPNLINTLEKAGVLVIALPGQFRGRDAFSLWAASQNDQRRPVIIVAGQPADRLRMSVAHELGHLVMHQPLTVGMGDVEGQAKEFAACFLLPENAMRHDLTAPVTLDTFLNLKPKWGVSMQALIVRAHELGIITPRKYHYLFSKLAARGWRVREPLSHAVPLERPRALRKIAELIYGHPVNYQRLAADAKLNQQFIEQIMESYAGKPRTVSENPKPEGSSPSSGGVITFALKRRK